MLQIYAIMISFQTGLPFENGIPPTRLHSYSQFIASGQQKGIKRYIIELLHKHPEGLSNRQMSEISGIEIGSLTNPIQNLYKSGKIIRSGQVKNTTRRLAITYKLSPSKKY